MLSLDDKYIKLAIPNKGRLKEPTIELLKKAGYDFRMKDRLLYATCKNAPIQIIFLRTDDIPLLVSAGVIDLGITGSDLVRERNAEVEEVLKLGYGKCRLCVAVRDEYDDSEVRALEETRIATSFPNITRQYFEEHNMHVHVIEMTGSLEITVGLKLSDAIVDIVETGDTLRDNNLKVFEEIGRFETVLIANKRVMCHDEVDRIRRRFEGVLIAARYSLLEYNIPEAKLKEAEAITPGFEAPTISKLDEQGWISVRVMVEKKLVVDAMDKLEALGASAIFETDIKNCRL